MARITRQKTLRRPIRDFVSRQRVNRIIAVVLGLWVLWILLAGDTSLVQLWKLKSENAVIQNEISELEQRMEDLATEEKNLQDPEYLEKLAREEYGMIREGETSYRIVETETDD